MYILQGGLDNLQWIAPEWPQRRGITAAAANLSTRYDAEAYLQTARQSFLQFRDGDGYKPPPPASSRDEATLPLWMPEYDRRISMLYREGYSMDGITKRNAAATKSARELIGALRMLQARGFKPMLHSGLLIGAMRHRGFIDFGGTQEGCALIRVLECYAFVPTTYRAVPMYLHMHACTYACSMFVCLYVWGTGHK